MSTIDTSTWNPDADLNTAIEGIPLNSDAGIAQTWKVIAILMAAMKGDTGVLETLVGRKATDSDVVHLAGAETVTGEKTFSQTINGTAERAVKDGAGNVIASTYATTAPATALSAGLMSASDKSKLDGLGSVFAFRGSVAAISALPSSGNTAGDVYAVESPVSVYAWSGSAWVQVSDDFAPMTSAQVEAVFDE